MSALDLQRRTAVRPPTATTACCSAPTYPLFVAGVALRSLGLLRADPLRPASFLAAVRARADRRDPVCLHGLTPTATRCAPGRPDAAPIPRR